MVDQLKNGGVGVIPTDTIYGIVGSALNKETVERIYKLRKRNPSKPFIILIGSLEDLGKFDIKLTDKQKEFLKNNWPNSLSVVLECSEQKWEYLHRGTNSLAFRMPKDEKLLDLLKKVGPLVAPSANWEGEKPAESIEEARKYFAEDVDFYEDGGIIDSSPSTLISLKENGSFILLREGLYKL